ncbi:hypothetical protein AB434_0912 [Heyndrickxia coagulans]|nr:hypothetical protein AB434_0912 [Heyndrickxia coagulans]KYC62565.1 hypothetical protein B4100_1616 [Heyndrickxia coagulans]KYC86451.1 hypothetical protein B4096_1560 [Heyndrickxia coagulans]
MIFTNFGDKKGIWYNLKFFSYGDGHCRPAKTWQSPVF